MVDDRADELQIFVADFVYYYPIGHSAQKKPISDVDGPIHSEIEVEVELFSE